MTMVIAIEFGDTWVRRQRLAAFALVFSEDQVPRVDDTTAGEAMTESKKLVLLRDKLIKQRREIVEHLQTAASVDLAGGDDLARIQNAINAVAKAITEEEFAEFHP